MDQIDARGQSTTLIHFAFQTNPTRLACMPNMIEFGETQYHGVHHHTNDARAVICPGCKKTDTYKRTLERNEIR